MARGVLRGKLFETSLTSPHPSGPTSIVLGPHSLEDDASDAQQQKHGSAEKREVAPTEVAEAEPSIGPRAL